MNTMTKTLAVAALAAFATTTTPRAAFAAVPTSITANMPGLVNYQGYLANPSTGAAYVDGIYTLDIRIWDSPADKTGCLWGGKYTVYVKDGYFNLMLGDPQASNLTAADGTLPTYVNADLWKALWDDGTTKSNIRYLGVTMRQDASHAVISSPVEIAPRQQLLSAPFAQRAQRAKYADQAHSTFTVPGKLTVSGGAAFSGTVTMPAGTTVGPIVANSSQVKLTGATTAASGTASVYDVGSYLYFYSYYNMDFKATSGNISFNVPTSGKSLKVTGAGDFISEAYNNKIGGNGYTQITGNGASSISLTGTGAMSLVTTGSSAMLQGKNAVTVRSTDSTATLRGKYTDVASDSYIKLSPSTDSGVYGQGPIWWAKPDATTSSSCVNPFKISKTTVTVAKGNTYADTIIESDNVYYNYVVVGFNGSGLAPAPNAVYAYKNGSTWYARVYLPASASSQWTYTVHVMGVHKCFGSDAR